MGCDVPSRTIRVEPNQRRSSRRRRSAVGAPLSSPICRCPLRADYWESCPTGSRPNCLRRQTNGGARRRCHWSEGSWLRLIMVLARRNSLCRRGSEGTLRGYLRHRLVRDVLANPGRAGHHCSGEFHCHPGRWRISRFENGCFPDSGAIPDQHCGADLEGRSLVWGVDAAAHPPVSDPDPSGALGTVVPRAGARAAFALGANALRSRRR